MARPTKRLTRSECEQIRHLWNEGEHKVDYVARHLGVTWQTAKRWLALCDIEIGENKRLDRSGLKWPLFDVQVTSEEGSVAQTVEAPNWAIAMEMVVRRHMLDRWETASVYTSKTQEPSPGFDRASVKEKLTDLLTQEQVKTLVMHYAALGVQRGG